MLRGLTLAALVWGLAANATPILAATVITGDLGSVFPDSAEIIAATPGPQLSGDDDGTSLSQTFQVLGAPLDLRSIFLEYEYDANTPSGDDNAVDIAIFTVADVAASTISAGAVLLSLSDVVFPDLGGSPEAQVILASTVLLPVNTGSEGYAIQITNGGNPGFEWRRTGSTRNNEYDFGQAYAGGSELNGGERDFVLALSSVPEPSSLVLSSLLLSTVAVRRRGK